MARAAARNVGLMSVVSKNGVHVSERQKDQRGIVAIGLLTQRDLEILGSGFRRAIPLTDAGDFDDLLARIDEAERDMENERSAASTARKPDG